MSLDDWSRDLLSLKPWIRESNQSRDVKRDTEYKSPVCFPEDWGQSSHSQADDKQLNKV